jgi:hypothetical protein
MSDILLSYTANMFILMNLYQLFTDYIDYNISARTARKTVFLCSVYGPSPSNGHYLVVCFLVLSSKVYMPQYSCTSHVIPILLSNKFLIFLCRQVLGPYELFHVTRMVPKHPFRSASISSFPEVCIVLLSSAMYYCPFFSRDVSISFNIAS